MTYPELISRLYDLQRLASVPEAGERSGNATSFDRNAQYDPATDTYIDWGANADGSGMIRMEGADTVVAELEGPGVIWRVWSAKPEQGHIQITIDGSDTPALDMPFADYFNNREGMFAYPELVHELSRGQNSYIPIAFAESCKVVMCEGWGMFYQITHTTFAPGTAVPSFSGAFDDATKDALAKANHTLAHRAVQPSTDAATDQQFVIPAGKSVDVLDAAGAGAITDLWAHVHLRGGDPRQVLRELTISIYWDGEPDPSVWAPLGDFFGSGPGLNRYASLPMGITQDGCYAKWYMPFADGARIVIANDGDVDRTIDSRIASEPLTQPADDLLRFHAKWHGDAFCDRDPERYLKGDRYPDWPMLITTGAGRFCGVNLQVWNPNAFGRTEPKTMADFDGYGENVTKYVDAMNGWWWGEGDEKFFVDGEKFPSTFGTGSEDYFGYAWAASFPQEFSSAFQNLPLCRDNCMGHVSQNRFQIADNVPFGESFEACIEKYHPNHWPLLYHCTAYWYQQAGESDPYAPVGLEARLPAGV